MDFEGLRTARMLRDNNIGATLVQNCDDRVAVERFIPEQRTEIYSLNQMLNANVFEALSWQQDKADQIAECIGQSEDFGRHAALGLADRLILRPPLRPVRDGEP